MTEMYDKPVRKIGLSSLRLVRMNEFPLFPPTSDWNIITTEGTLESKFNLKVTVVSVY